MDHHLLILCVIYEPPLTNCVHIHISRNTRCTRYIDSGPTELFPLFTLGYVVRGFSSHSVLVGDQNAHALNIFLAELDLYVIFPRTLAAWLCLCNTMKSFVNHT